MERGNVWYDKMQQDPRILRGYIIKCDFPFLFINTKHLDVKACNLDFRSQFYQGLLYLLINLAVVSLKLG